MEAYLIVSVKELETMLRNAKKSMKAQSGAKSHCVSYHLSINQNPMHMVNHRYQAQLPVREVNKSHYP